MAYQDRDRDYRRSAVEFDDVRRVPARSPAPPRRGREDFEVDVRVRERDTDGLDFIRRRPEAGPMVLRSREADPLDHRERDRSPVRYRDDRSMSRAKSVSPSRELEHERTRVIERERIRSPSVVRRRSPSPNRNIRYVDPPENEHIHTRIIERERERIPSPSPSPSPPPAAPVIRGPVIEREVITHWTDVDHGIVSARPRSPPSSSRRREETRDRERERERERDTRETRERERDTRERERETRDVDIDISLSKGRAEVDIHRSASRTRSKSRERRSSRFFEDDLNIRRDLKIDDSAVRRRARSVGTQDDESEYITSRVDSRGQMGEAFGGATKAWTIVDVPPGTERIRMDGIGGGTTDTTYSRYSGVRRTKFIPEREGSVVEAPTPPSASARGKDHRLNVAIYDREREIDIDRRITRSPAPPPKEMWTEITKDLVIREAIEELGYEYEETDYFFYVMEYLRYEDVLQLTDLSDEIRRNRKQRSREVRYDRDHWDETDRRYYETPATGRRQPTQGRRDEIHDRIRETETIYDTRREAARPSYR